MQASHTAARVVEALIRDYGFKQGNNGWLNGGRCPECDKKELYTHSEKPWVIRCGRESKCGVELRSKELYPELHAGFNKLYKATETNPNATADAYLQHARGFDTSKLKGWYEQGAFQHPDANKPTATVRFYITTPDAPAGAVFMERLVEEVTITDPETKEKTPRKQHFKGKHGGFCWTPPGLIINDGDEIHIVEACLDAIALNLNGMKAVACLSAGNYPSKFIAQHKEKDVLWVWALDNDKAGRKNSQKHARRMRTDGYQVAAMQVPGHIKEDWNDLHQKNRLDNKSIETYRHHGDLLLATSASEKALLIYKYSSRLKFHFEYENRLFWFALNLEKYDKAVNTLKDGDKDGAFTDEEIRDKALVQANAITEIANCAFRFLYYQSNVVTDESWYYCQVTFPHAGPPIKNTFTGSQIAGAGEFKKRLLSIAAGALYTGDNKQLDRIIGQQLRLIKTVQTIDFVGYCKEHKCYVYNDLAVTGGQVYRLNTEDYFDAGKLSIKSLNQSVSLNINSNAEQYRDDWLGMIQQCFGHKGMTALAFWLGALFAEQIRDLHKSYPFIEIIGEPGAGKSTLIEFLWKLCGRRDYEGFDPSKSTLAARARNFSQVANLPVVLIEGDRDDEGAKQRGFDFDELKTAFNGRSVRSRGMKNGGNETYEPPFRGAVVISQNAEVNASEAVKQRLIHTHFTKEHHTRDSKVLSEQLERMPMENVSGFLLRALSHEHDILDTVIHRTPVYEAKLSNMEGIKSVRIAKNHAQMMALVEALTLITPLTREQMGQTIYAIAEMAVERQQAINADHSVVQRFWETVEYLDGDDDSPRLNHSKDPGQIAISMGHLQKIAHDQRQSLPDITELKRHLKTSKKYKYVKHNHAVASSLYPRNFDRATVKCWIFSKH